MAKYTLAEPFDIDDGELDGLGPQFIFVLGVEWQLFRQQMQETVGPFEAQTHTANVERLKALCERHGRTVKVCWLHEDYPEWRVLHVGSGPT